jgi:hypothetical protein
MQKRDKASETLMPSMENEPIIARIRDWCFAQEPQKLDDHNLFQALLVNLLKENGWYAYKEYELEKYPRINPLTGKIREHQGFIDICAFAHNRKLVIEYDTSTQLRSKSISKLFCSGADFPIGIVRGKRGKAFLKFENTSKINRIAKNSGIINKGIYLIVIENKIAEWVHVGKQVN